LAQTGDDDDDLDDFLEDAFNHVDTNGNGFISKKEFFTALRELTKAFEFNPTKADKQWAKEAWKSKSKKQVNEEVFANLTKNLLEKFDISPEDIENAIDA